jgi:cystathionine beta-lyase/cystathionine gamma-synthase
MPPAVPAPAHPSSRSQGSQNLTDQLETVSKANFEAVKRRADNNSDDPGYGCLLSIEFEESFNTTLFYDALEVCKGPSLGTNFTLVSPYVLLAHYYELSWAGYHPYF